MMNQDGMMDYIHHMKKERVNFSRLTDQEITELNNLTRDNKYTLSAVLMFGTYPQSFYPQLCTTAIRIPGTEIGELGSEGERFMDNRRIEGNIQDMFKESMIFIQANIKTKTMINPQTGQRDDKTEYPISAIREAILNALAHRDYSMYSEGMPVQIIMFADRIEIKNPGGLYGRLRIDQLGKIQPDTRNPVLVSMMEAMNLTENRYSGIPTIYREMRAAGLPEPEFIVERGNFVVRLWNISEKIHQTNRGSDNLSEDEIRLLKFCQTPKNRKEIADFLNITTVWYATTNYVMPLVERSLLELSIPAKPGSSKQTYRSTISFHEN